jgi:hypothetical protein
MNVLIEHLNCLFLVSGFALLIPSKTEGFTPSRGRRSMFERSEDYSIVVVMDSRTVLHGHRTTPALHNKPRPPMISLSILHLI